MRFKNTLLFVVMAATLLVLLSSCVGLNMNFSLTRPTRTPAMGMVKGMSEISKAAEAMDITFFDCGTSLFVPDWVHCVFTPSTVRFTVVSQGTCRAHSACWGPGQPVG